MKTDSMTSTAMAMVAPGKGLLAMDESTPTCNKRFEKLGIPPTHEMRRAWRELIVTTPGLVASISGAILFDETVRQETSAGVPMLRVLTDAGIIPGIKVDGGAKAMAGHLGEKITEGLDGLPRSADRVCDDGAALREVARGDHDRRRHPVVRLHRGERARAGAIRGVVPGSGAGADRRAGGAPGGLAHARPLRGGDAGGAARGVRSTRPAARRARRDDPQAQHGVARLNLPGAGIAGRRGGRDGAVPAAHRPGGRAGRRVSLGRAVGRAGVGAAERDARSVSRRGCRGN